jgi:hypothetical protein
MIGTTAAGRRADPRFGPWLSAAGVAILCLWVGGDLLARVIKSGGAWADTLVDFRLIYDFSRSVVATGQYPPLWPYPPGGVLLFAAVSSLPYELAAGLWLAGLGGAAVACWLTLASTLKWEWGRGHYLALPVAHLTCTYFFQWDLRSANCNLFVLLTLVISLRALSLRSDVPAGVWLAFAVTLKLYAFPVVAYYAWARRWRAVIACGVAIVGMWLVAPVIAFGPAKSLTLYEGWVGTVRHATGGADLETHPILTSLERAGRVLAGERGQRWFPNVGKAVWAGVFVLAWRLAARRRHTNDPHALVADISVFAILPVAISPYLEPYHAVPFALPAAVLVSTATDTRQRSGLRWFAGISFVLTWAVMRVPIDWYAKGLLINVKLAVGVVAAVFVAHWRLANTTTASPSVRAHEGLFDRLTRAFRMRTTAG